MFSVSTCSEPQTPAQTIDYAFAREELMLKELSNDPLQAAIATIERQHEEDKQGKGYVCFRFSILIICHVYTLYYSETNN